MRCVYSGVFFFFSSRRRHTRYWRDWSSDVCSSDLHQVIEQRGDRPVGARGGRGEVLIGHAEQQGSQLADRRVEVQRHSRSEERRVGEEGRSRGGPDHLKKKKKSTVT